MRFDLTPEEKAFQQEIREFMDKEVNDGVIAETESMQGPGPHTKELLRKFGKERMLAPSWPKEYGTRGMSFTAETVFMDELISHRGPFPLDGIEIGRGILAYGSESMKKKFLPPIARGEIDIALGYTEPDAGSDLASLQLRAVEDGDSYILNGQKIYNTEAHHCEYHWVLTRTDTTVPRHKGLSLFIVDLKSPGITIRPLYTMAGLRTNEVFYEDVRVLKENMVGEKNQGWEIAQNALRGGPGMSNAGMRQRFSTLLKYVLEEGSNLLSEKPWIRDELAKWYVTIHIGDLLGYRTSYLGDKGIESTYEAPLAITFTDESRKAFFRSVMELLGPYGQLAEVSKRVPMDGVMMKEFMDSPRWTIVHGTSEIRRILIARGLGLPRK